MVITPAGVDVGGHAPHPGDHDPAVVTEATADLH